MSDSVGDILIRKKLCKNCRVALQINKKKVNNAKALNLVFANLRGHLMPVRRNNNITLPGIWSILKMKLIDLSLFLIIKVLKYN